MSRIHEALQKASEENGNAPDASTETAAVGIELSDLQATFPVEMGERRKPRPQGVGSPAALKSESFVQRDETGADDHRLSFHRLDSRYAGKVVIDQNISPESREQYRRLAASLHQAQATAKLKVVMLTSAVTGEGKTLTSSNLALTLSESYQKNVLLIDADLRRPAVHGIFRLRNNAGLTDGLADTTDRKIPIHQVSSRLSVLAAGKPTQDPIAGLTSMRMRRILTEARDAFDWVIVDTPPVAMLSDANLLSAMVDGAVIVVRAGSTPFELVQRAAAAIGQERLLGVVLNGATDEGTADYYGYSYYSSNEEPAPST